MFKISASLFVSDDPLIYAKQLKSDEIDYFHLDYIEGIRSYFQLNRINIFDSFKIPLDVHLICSTIGKDTISILNNSSTRILSVQFENLVARDRAINYLLDFKYGFGFAVSPNTDLKFLYPYRHIMNHIMVMCSTPGVSGAKFNESSIDYIRKVRLYFPGISIYIDGGLDAEKFKYMRCEDVSLTVFGSYLYKNRNNLQMVLKELKSEL